MRKADFRTLSVYKNKPFSRFARKARISDADLWKAAQRANDGLIDADLGGGVIKLRIARSGEGKSGGSRSILFFKQNDRAIFVHGFEKKDEANIQTDELEGFRKFAKIYLSFTEFVLDELVDEGKLYRIEKPEEDDNA